MQLSPNGHFGTIMANDGDLGGLPPLPNTSWCAGKPVKGIHWDEQDGEGKEGKSWQEAASVG